ncbi:MAG: hypothetical protein ABIR96_05635 [Bdellovibrionota bacterium]
MKASIRAFVLLGLCVTPAFAADHNSGVTSLGSAGSNFGGLLNPFSGGNLVDSVVDQAYRSGQCKEVEGKNGMNSVPVDFLKGMGYSLVRSLCGRGSMNEYSANSVGSVKGLLTAPAGLYSKNDVLASSHYNTGAMNVAGPGNAASTYAILAALAMQESDANIVESVDTSKNASLNSQQAAEAGAYQMSADSQDLLDKGAYQELLGSYVSSLQAAASNPLRIEAICRISKFTGDGKNNSKKAINPQELIQRVQQAMMGVSSLSPKLDPEKFQEMNKSCPAFATEYAALVARANLGHNGPLVRGEVKPSEGCTQMFEKLSKMSSDQSICSDVGLSTGIHP